MLVQRRRFLLPAGLFYLSRFSAVIVFMVFFLQHPAARAADIDEQDAGTVQHQLTSEEMAAGLGRQAEERKKIEGFQSVRYDEILDDPDNLDLNFRYARQQLLNDNFLGASATLERILMIDPNLDSVRLYFAIALYRLENLMEAERELTRVLAGDIPPKIREQAQGYLKQIRSQKRKTRGSFRQTVGYGYDHNRNAASHAGVSFTNDIAMPLTGSSLRHSDTHFLTISNLRVERDFGRRKGNYVFGSLTHFLQEQTNVDNLDMESLGGNIGARFKTDIADFTPSFSMGHLFLDRETFLRTQALGLTAERAFTKRWAAQLGAQIQRQDYQNTKQSSTSEEREGPQFDTNATVDYLLTPSMKLFSTVGYRNKYAKRKYNAYQELLLQQSHLWLLGKGQFLINSLEANFDYYSAANPEVQATFRKDLSMRYRVTYGAPLTFLQIGKILPKPFKDIQAMFTYEYYRNVSTISSNTYRNYKFQFALSKVFEF